jgi:hypothetical protein
LLHFNPIAGSTEFDSLEPIVKVIISNIFHLTFGHQPNYSCHQLEILRALVEWQLEDCVAIRSLIEKHCRGNRYQEDNPIDVSPVGIDSKKRIYWQFGDSARLWREKQGAKTEERSQWEIGKGGSLDQSSFTFILLITSPYYSYAHVRGT